MNTVITLPVSELKSCLTGLGKVIGRKSTLPVLQHVRISRDSKGMVSLQATDLDAFVTYHASEDQPGPLVEVLLPIEQLAKAVKSSSAKDSVSLVIEPKEKVKLRYSMGGSPLEQSVPTLDLKEWPPVPEVNQPATALDKEFGVALKQALECCSNDPSRYILRGACLDVADKKYHYIVSTNGRMLYSANSFCFDLQKTVVIPDSKFLSASDFLDDEGGLLSVGAGKDVNYVKLESPRWTYVSKQIEGNYPNWKQVVPKSSEKATKIILNDAALKQLLAVVPNLPGDKDADRVVRIRFDLQSVFIEAKAKDQSDWTSIRVQEAVAKGRQVMVALNREYLLKAVRFGLKTVEIEDELSPIIFWNAGKKMVVMPVRLDASPAPVPKTPPAEPEKESTPVPSSQPSETTTNERKTMPRTATRIQTPANSETTQTSNGEQNGHENGSVMKSLTDKVEQIRETLKGVMRDLGEVTDGLKLAEKEKRATEKEIEGFRASLKKIQSFSI
jgi:DNA polymerase III sliding clamp (beta) subunit (PCNA family)